MAIRPGLDDIVILGFQKVEIGIEVQVKNQPERVDSAEIRWDSIRGDARQAEGGQDAEPLDDIRAGESRERIEPGAERLGAQLVGGWTTSAALKFMRYGYLGLGGREAPHPWINLGDPDAHPFRFGGEPPA